MIKTNKKELLIGLISDTHVPSRTSKIPEVIINDFKQRNVDYVFHLGDFTSIDAYNQLIDLFGKERVIGISGNMDEREIKKSLPETMDLDLYGHKIFLTHGIGGPNIVIKRLNRYYDLSKYDIIIFGHVHRPYNEIWKDGKLYLNPGTPSDKRFTDINSYGYLRISKEKVEPEIIEL
ncbi:MAG: metallophosphoesterase family protein [Promethearchaeota archaeon]